MECETIPWTFPLVILQSIGLSWTLSGSVTYAWFLWFLSSCIVCLQNVSCELYKPPKCCHLSLYSIKKITFVNIFPYLIRKICKIWSCQAYGDRYRVFQYLNFPLKAQILSLAANIITCFPRSDRLTLFIFEKMSAKYPHLNNHTLLIIHSNKRGVSWKKQLVQHSNNHPSAFPWDSRQTSVCSRRAFCLLLIWSHKMLKGCVFKGCVLFLSETGLFPLQVCGSEEYDDS